MSSLARSTIRRAASRGTFSTLSLAALFAVAGCRETTTCAENPSPVCPDAAGPAMDAGPPDAFRRPDANLDAPGLDAFEVVPDAWTPDDAWAPDAGSDAGPCSRCPSSTPACFMDTCVECASNADCVGAAGGPACDLDTHTCVACTVGTDCTAPLAACLPTNTCVRCDDRADCGGGTPACVGNDCVQCENRSDCSGGTPACVGNACVQCETRSDCSGGTPACFGNGCVQCEMNTDCTERQRQPLQRRRPRLRSLHGRWRLLAPRRLPALRRRNLPRLHRRHRGHRLRRQQLQPGDEYVHVHAAWLGAHLSDVQRRQRVHGGVHLCPSQSSAGGYWQLLPPHPQ
jgi:hypothetical protein